MASQEAPESTLPYPPIHKDKKFVVLSDWDGTITTRDSNDYMTDELGFGREKRRELNFATLAGERTFRDTFREMLESVVDKGHSFDYCKEELKKNIKLDSGFKEFYRYCESVNIPVVIISSGMTPLIRVVLSNLIGEEDANKIEIVSNEVNIHPDGKWEIQYRHPSSGYGHDKSQAILPYRQLSDPPIIFFFGDGVSDMSAAKHADVLFVKQKEDGENDLHQYCVRQGIPHILFSNFSRAHSIVRQVVEGKLTVKEALAIGQA